MKGRRWIAAVLIFVMMFLLTGFSAENDKDSPDQFREKRYQEALSLFEDGFHADAVNILLELADDVNAQFNLGLCYENGYGVEQDLGRAVEWFEKAAAQGHTKAQNFLNELRQKGLY